MRIVINLIVFCLLQKVGVMAWQRTCWSLNLTRTERTCGGIKRVILSFSLSFSLNLQFYFFHSSFTSISPIFFVVVSSRKAGRYFKHTLISKYISSVSYIRILLNQILILNHISVPCFQNISFKYLLIDILNSEYDILPGLLDLNCEHNSRVIMCRKSTSYI